MLLFSCAFIAKSTTVHLPPLTPLRKNPCILQIRLRYSRPCGDGACYLDVLPGRKIIEGHHISIKLFRVLSLTKIRAVLPGWDLPELDVASLGTVKTGDPWTWWGVQGGYWRQGLVIANCMIDCRVQSCD